MAVVQTVTVTRRGVVGDRRAIEADITFDTGTYVTGGQALVASDFGLVKLDGVEVVSSDIHPGEYDHVTGKFRLRVSSTGAEVGNAVALTASAVNRVRAYGY